jgi:hypothetical protein
LTGIGVRTSHRNAGTLWLGHQLCGD